MNEWMLRYLNKGSFLMRCKVRWVINECTCKIRVWKCHVNIKWPYMSNSQKKWQIWYLKVFFFEVSSMGVVQLCSTKAISDIWIKSFFLGGRWGILKIICPLCMKFLVVIYKNEPQDLWKLLCTHLKSEWKYSRKYFSYYYYDKNCRKNIISMFMSKIINSFPYVVALTKSMSHNIR